MSLASTPKVERLRDRAQMLQKARAFFAQRGIVEVDCPIVSLNASIDPHIDLITACHAGRETCYLHSSPEYGMKRLLAEGIGDCYQLAHVFRDGDKGHRHNPEFMMAEWYRIGFSLEQMFQETVDFVRLLLGPLPSSQISYRNLFKKVTGLDYCTASNDELLAYIRKSGLAIYTGIETEGKDALLNFILGTIIEPTLGQDELTVLAYYPASQAALAKKRVIDDELVAERFEIYYKGIELANGYHELADAAEQRERLLEANQQRESMGKKALPIDENFLEALEKGIPDCSGVAVGFDRLMMLRHPGSSIHDVIAWGWDVA